MNARTDKQQQNHHGQMGGQIRRGLRQLRGVVRWVALRAWLPLLTLLLSACSGTSTKVPGSIPEGNMLVLNIAAGLWGAVFGLWILGWIFWLGSYAIQGWWDAPWKRVAGWAAPAAIYGVIGNVVMGMLYGLALANVNGYTPGK